MDYQNPPIQPSYFKSFIFQHRTLTWGKLIISDTDVLAASSIKLCQAEFWFNLELLAAAMGAIICNFNDECLRLVLTSWGNTPIIIVEVTSLHNGILIALEENMNAVIIEGDNIVIVNDKLGKWCSP